MNWPSSDEGINDKIGHGTFCTALLLDIAPHAEVYVTKLFDSSIATAETAGYVAKVRLPFICEIVLNR
jgi:hypothetical protein